MIVWFGSVLLVCTYCLLLSFLEAGGGNYLPAYEVYGHSLEVPTCMGFQNSGYGCCKDFVWLAAIGMNCVSAWTGCQSMTWWRQVTLHMVLNGGTIASARRYWREKICRQIVLSGTLPLVVYSLGMFLISADFSRRVYGHGSYDVSFSGFDTARLLQWAIAGCVFILCAKAAWRFILRNEQLLSEVKTSDLSESQFLLYVRNVQAALFAVIVPLMVFYALQFHICNQLLSSRTT